MGVDQRGVVDVQVDGDSPVAASGTFTLESVVATDAITIGTVTFTFTSDPSLTTDVEVDGADDAADAAALAAAINAHATVKEIVTATVDGAEVTVTAKQKGVVGNFINISSADNTITASGTHLEGGAGGVTEAGESYAMGIS
jgi:phage tail sheath gpL-like